MGKSRNEFGVLLKEEASYGDGGTLAGASDGILVNEEAWPELGYIHDGARRGESGPVATGLQNVKKSGRFAEVPLIAEAHGGGAAYSASVKPNVHVPLLLAGFDATLDATGGSEKYTYALGAGSSGVGEFYAREQMIKMLGILADLSITADGPEVPVWEFALSGLAELPTEAAVPSITYPSVKPPKAENITLQMGSFGSAVVRSHGLSLNRSLSARGDQNSGGHKGFKGGTRFPTLEVEIEADSFVSDPYHAAGGINPYQLAELATALSLSLVVGDTQYNRYKINASNAQLQPVGDDEDEASAIWTLTFDLRPSAPGQKDNFTIVFD